MCIQELLFLSSEELINFLDLSFVSSSSSSSQNATHPLSHPSGGSDYYSEYEDITAEPPRSSSTYSELPDLNPCDYDMCVEQQHTCLEIAETTRCLCPGLSNGFIPPSPPRLLNLTQQDGKGVVVHWCAPTSIVTHYNVFVRGNGKVKEKKEVEKRKRAAVLEDVEAGMHICVEAVNKGGVSAEDDQSCATFEPQNTDSGLVLKLGIIGGVVGLILLLILALLLWRHKSRQKFTMRTKTERVL
uniref:LRRN4 C-terminal-like protein n=2 Tax=Cyprinus carpio TaxID=7962 RepID=A0A8C0YUS9_CYPCA